MAYQRPALTRDEAFPVSFVHRGSQVVVDPSALDERLAEHADQNCEAFVRARGGPITEAMWWQAYTRELVSSLLYGPTPRQRRVIAAADDYLVAKMACRAAGVSCTPDLVQRQGDALKALVEAAEDIPDSEPLLVLDWGVEEHGDLWRVRLHCRAADGRDYTMYSSGLPSREAGMAHARDVLRQVGAARVPRNPTFN